ncbi:MAG: hypothetical protein U9P71_03650 [Campylobacterota bacterium]|nr:hypothetical protein [Campylobacterota bacterium]
MNKLFILLSLILLTASNAKSENILLDFEKITTTPDSVANFYDTEFGVVFDTQAAAYRHADRAFSNEPSFETILYSSSDFFMHRPSGFKDILSFYHSNNHDTSVTIFDASSNILATATLTATGNPDPNNPSIWERATINFNGTATRVAFSGDTLYDNIQLGKTTVPTLSGFFKLLLLMLLAGISIRRLQPHRS